MSGYSIARNARTWTSHSLEMSVTFPFCVLHGLLQEPMAAQQLCMLSRANVNMPWLLEFHHKRARLFQVSMSPNILRKQVLWSCMFTSHSLPLAWKLVRSFSVLHVFCVIISDSTNSYSRSILVDHGRSQPAGFSLFSTIITFGVLNKARNCSLFFFLHLRQLTIYWVHV